MIASETREEGDSSETVSPLQTLFSIKERMIRDRDEIKHRLSNLQQCISNIDKDIRQECGKIGHKMAWEVEDGPYGERYHYCEMCGHQ